MGATCSGMAARRQAKRQAKGLLSLKNDGTYDVVRPAF